MSQYNNNSERFFEFIPKKLQQKYFELITSEKDGAFHNFETVEKCFAKFRCEDISKPFIFVGTGTCGLGAGAAKTLDVIKEYLSENNIEAEIVEVGCIGLCSSEPIVDIQLPGKSRISYGNATHKNIDQILDATFKGQIVNENVIYQFKSKKFHNWYGVPDIMEHPFFAKQTRWVLENCGTTNPVSIHEYVARNGYVALMQTLHQRTSKDICNMIERSGLRGRGGGGFLTGKKWQIALAQNASQKYFICNADEGDPGAFMDRAVIEGDPHRLLEGLAIAAYGIGADKAYVYIRAEYPLAIKRLVKAIEDAKAWGFLGDNILDSGYGLNIYIKMGAGAFVCGEETALMHSIEGKRGMPRPRPPFPAVRGLFNSPTVINNVETLANVPKIVLKGDSWFSSAGTAGSKGTKVFALSGKVNRTGLVEVTMGMKIRDIIFSIGGGIPNNREYKAVQIGGPSGGCVTKDFLDIEIDYESLKTVDAMMGSGGLVVMDDQTCMVDLAKYFMDFIQRESCGKCIPCREGTKRMLEILENITKGRNQEKGNDALKRFQGVIELTELANVIRDTSLCGLGQSAPNPVLSTLKYFRKEYEDHIFRRSCSAGVCRDMISFKIDVDKCEGCTACAKKCPSEAIAGVRKEAHHINDEKCTRCGICISTCTFNAISKIPRAEIRTVVTQG